MALIRGLEAGSTAFNYSQISQLAHLRCVGTLFLDKFAQMMVKSYGGDPAQVPSWRTTSEAKRMA
jgi:hypothetical protein